MATLVLGAAGAALGAGFGGTVAGLSGAVIGRAVGATLGQAIDQRLMGAAMGGAAPVAVGHTDRFRLMGAGEGAAIARVWGRARVAGQVIWASDFSETVTKQGGGGKGGARGAVLSYSYSVSLALALCEGVASHVGRIWADGVELDPGLVQMRFYPGDDRQLPDPLLVADLGADAAPAFRGTAYVVIENMALERFGNRVPQISLEVFCTAPETPAVVGGYADAIRAVALIPGTGEYGLATTPVAYPGAPGQSVTANVHSVGNRTDFAVALDQMTAELPKVGSVSLVVSWFGTDLRCDRCSLRPKVEQRTTEGAGMVWQAGGIVRAEAQEVPRQDGASVYGGTPADAAVLEAISALRAAGQEVMFYPFVLMDQLAGNRLADPWTLAVGQPALPWRGRITTSVAAGKPGSPQGTTAARAEVAAFFGTAQPQHFDLHAGQVVYSGPQNWGYRRFVLHYATLVAAAGGVDSFCIGSEFVSLNQIRAEDGSFPAVAEWMRLASDVRTILGPKVKIGYAADWSEYAGCQIDGDRLFHLDPLWAHGDIDFIGIDNYMPLSDWRPGEDHADRDWGAVYDLGYLQANIAGGEGFDWYYDGPEGVAAQYRRPITDPIHQEPWVWRVKDLRGWWENPHHDRINGQRSPEPSPWVPGSKPIWFTEYGCPAVHLGSNEPNRFVDRLSAEAGLPRASLGHRDDLIQLQYFRAMAAFWNNPGNNPRSSLYAGPMVDMTHAHAWAWDARPFPAFPAASAVWADGANYDKGHWLNGRVSAQPADAVIQSILGDAVDGAALDVTRAHGLVRGLALGDVQSQRAALQPVMLANGIEAFERDGTLIFARRAAAVTADIGPDDLAEHSDLAAGFERSRDVALDMPGRVRIGFTEAQGDYLTRAGEAVFADASPASPVAGQELPMVMTRAEARGVAERWLAETRLAQTRLRLALPLSRRGLGAGDVIRHDGIRYRIDHVEQGDRLLIEAVAIDAGLYSASDATDETADFAGYVPPAAVLALFLDLPVLTGAEDPQTPWVAATATPWPGRVAVWSADQDAGYTQNRVIAAPAFVGVTETPLVRARVGLWDRGPGLRVRMAGAQLAQASEFSVLNGANLAAIGDGTPGGWELFQFQTATLIAPDLWELSLRLRGQFGTDATMPEVWPSGSYVVLVNDRLTQIDPDPAARGLARHYRIGVGARGYDDPMVSHQVCAFDGIGLRPYGVCHLRAVAVEGDVQLSWVRRTRIGGDSWQGIEVPLAEAFESYSCRVFQGQVLVRQATVSRPGWTYTAAMRQADGITGAYTVAVAQLSDSFGPGPYQSITLG